MNRVIKFRAWHKAGEVMLLDGVDSPLNDCDEIFAPGWDRFYSELDFIQRDAVLMQFTGLTDNNGVEIYEGDVLTGIDGYGDKVWLNSPVIFAKSAFCLDKGARRPRPIYAIDGVSWEVTGNIYENPELLK